MTTIHELHAWADKWFTSLWSWIVWLRNRLIFDEGKIQEIMVKLQDLIAKVTLLENRGDALIALFKGLAQEVRDLKPD